MSVNERKRDQAAQFAPEELALPDPSISLSRKYRVCQILQILRVCQILQIVRICQIWQIWQRWQRTVRSAAAHSFE